MRRRCSSRGNGGDEEEDEDEDDDDGDDDEDDEDDGGRRGRGREVEKQRRREGGGWMQVTVEVGTRFVIHRDRRRGREATMRHSVSAIGLRIFSAFQEFQEKEYVLGFSGFLISILDLAFPAIANDIYIQIRK